MKSKFYWQRRHEQSGPFDLPRRISEGISACHKTIDDALGAAATVRYIWIHLTNDGLRHGHTPQPESPTLDDWLNIIDESAALGAQWVVIYVGASLGQAPVVWDLCKWSQEVHGLNVGLHLRCDCLSADDVERIARLDRERTFLVADGECMEALRVLQERGVQVCESDLHLRETLTRCTKPADMCCVGPDGHLFSCGLVLGEAEFALGNVRDRALGEVISDASLPHAIEDASRFPTRGCEGCPPYIAEQVEHLRGGR
jgi:radical SAM protein with 4Fe4S-binding SPASM domain